MLAKSTDDYGLAVTDQSLIRVAITPHTFLLQAELRAINSGLEYRETVDEDGIIYNGYVNKDGQKEGVGIMIYRPKGFKFIGEYHLDKSHGCMKFENADRGTYWGEYKDN